MRGVRSVHVQRVGYLALERYAHDGLRDRPHNVKSITKSIVSALVGIAVACAPGEAYYLPMGHRPPQSSLLGR